MIACLCARDAGDYSLVKSSLLAKGSEEDSDKKKKKPNKSVVKFARGLGNKFTKWVKGSDADGDFSKLKDPIRLERFYETLLESMRL